MRDPVPNHAPAPAAVGASGASLAMSSGGSFFFR